MPETPSFDLIVIGAGPGGYVAAIRAAQLGMKVACVEREYLGGTCLNVGCIPSKALLDSSEKYYATKNHLQKHGIDVGDVRLNLTQMMTRKDQVVKSLTGGVGMLFRKNKVEHLPGQGRIIAPDTVEVVGADGSARLHKAKKILIATGSAPIELPGLKFDEKNILSSTGVLALKELPKKMIVVGAGYIGLEMASVWSRLGTDVLVLEFLDRCLPPSDAEMAAALQKLLEKQGLKFRFKTVAESAKVENGKVKVTTKTGDQTVIEEVDKVLVCVGRKPVTDKLGLDKIGVTMSPRGFVLVNDKFQTNIPGIYAIGDVIGKIMLAHNAEEEGIAAVELMAGQAGHVNYACCPSVVYTHPELAQVGLTEEDAKERGPVNIGKFPFIANGRAKGMDETDGFVKVIADAKTDRVLGVHILAAHASDMIAEATVAMEFGASSEDIARSFHAHPTLPEALKEAALAVEKRAIHIQIAIAPILEICMDADALRALQAPLKERYRSDPATALVTLHAEGQLGQDVSCSVETGRAMIKAGLHPATGGDGLAACSGDMLLQALAACAGVTLRAVATALQIDLRGGTVHVEGDLDFRGTLGVSKEVPVGFREIRLKFDLDAAATREQLDTLTRLTERYCVVYQTLRQPPAIHIACEAK